MCLLMMKKTINAALIFFLLVDQMLHIFGNVIVLRKTLDHRRQVACLTENDGSALIWNDELISQMYQIVLSHKNKFNNKENINCKMNANEDCLNSWTKQYWNITYSFKTPMAPVFDERWEEFTEYSNKNVYDRIAFDSLPTSATALSFSVRASSDVYIFLCNSKNYRTDFCYWIVIGGWKNTLSVIRKCTRGVPVPGQYTVQNSKCAQNQVEFRHKPLSTTEWRSFVITWDSAIRNITVYDTDKMIMTYVDKEERKLSEILPHIDYQVFIRSNPSMLLRFHLYHFLHTTIEGATLTSPIFKLNDTTICIQMFIGLCPECDAHVFLRDSTSNEVLEMVTAKGSSKTAIYGLPTWQSVKIEKNLPTTKSVVIQLIPKLNMSSANPLWAIANVQQCPNEYWKRIFTSKVGSNNYVWPNMTCQKLFYDEHTIVSSASSVRNNIKDDDTNCNNHTSMIGPRCSISCENNFMFDYRASCRSVVICYKNGCTCPPGFIGSECTDTCGLNKYGHNCNKSCGSCAKEIDHEGNFCNKITGFCYGGCKNTKKLYIPPLCHTGIDTSVALVTNYTNQTSVQVTIPMTWKDEYEEATIFYSFIIQGQFNNYYVQKSWNRIFPNTTHLIGNFADLEIGTTYLIKYGLQIEKSTVYSDWHSVETDCIPILLFDITLGETNLTINWQINENVSLRQQSCPPNWYRLEVQHTNTVCHL
nr:PREDICTED: uncharacterized protein LOC105677103 [Linepithema humile]